MRVQVRGVVYDTVPECAEALGVSVATVYDAILRRNPDTLGLGPGAYGRAHPRIPRKEFKFGRLHFASHRDVDRALNAHLGYTSHVISRGTGNAKMILVRRLMELQAKIDRQEQDPDQWDGTTATGRKMAANRSKHEGKRAGDGHSEGAMDGPTRGRMSGKKPSSHTPNTK